MKPLDVACPYCWRGPGYDCHAERRWPHPGPSRPCKPHVARVRDANCYTCVYRRDVPGDSHVMCVVGNARVVGDPTGIRNGWFVWPFNFDPTWLVSCDKHETQDNGASRG